METYCTSCCKKVPKYTNQCECGETCFVVGSSLEEKENEIICNCGCSDFTLLKLDEFTDRHELKFKCKNCDSKLKIINYIDIECNLCNEEDDL